MEVLESQQGRTADAPLCLTCGTKMRPAGSCYVCEGCGSTSGCSLFQGALQGRVTSSGAVPALARIPPERYPGAVRCI